jgi:hypothetical protein
MKTEEYAQHACLYCLLKGPRNGITEGNPSFSAEFKCPAAGGVFYFDKGAMKACFQEHLKGKWKRPEGSFKLCRFSLRDHERSE